MTLRSPKQLHLYFNAVPALLRHLFSNLISFSVLRKNFDDPELFPLILVGDGETPWTKLSLGYDFQRETYTLSVDETPFPRLPYQAELVLLGAQNIDHGTIALNGVAIIDGYKQYKSNTFIFACQDRHLINPITEVFIDFVYF